MGLTLKPADILTRFLFSSDEEALVKLRAIRAEEVIMEQETKIFHYHSVRLWVHRKINEENLLILSEIVAMGFKPVTEEEYLNITIRPEVAKLFYNKFPEIQEMAELGVQNNEKGLSYLRLTIHKYFAIRAQNIKEKQEAETKEMLNKMRHMQGLFSQSFAKTP